jgi:thiamine-monophosphate kinase
LTGGDDYELCFTAAAEREQAVFAAAARHGVPVARIGAVHSGAALRCMKDGREFALPAPGYVHFR